MGRGAHWQLCLIWGLLIEEMKIKRHTSLQQVMETWSSWIQFISTLETKHFFERTEIRRLIDRIKERSSFLDSDNQASYFGFGLLSQNTEIHILPVGNKTQLGENVNFPALWNHFLWIYVKMCSDENIEFSFEFFCWNIIGMMHVYSNIWKIQIPVATILNRNRF